MDSIQLEGYSVEAEAGPLRQLRLTCNLRHTSSNSITNLVFHPRVSIADVVIFEGIAGWWEPGGEHGALVEPHGEIILELPLVLGRGVLESIEAARTGDVEIRVDGFAKYSIAHKIKGQGHWNAGESRDMALGADSEEWVMDVPQSEWVKLLNQMNWGLTDLVETSIELGDRGAATRHLEVARQHFMQGHWPEVLGSCYKAVEACVPKSSDDVADMAPHLTSDAQDALDELCRKSKKLMHDGRHHNAGELGRQDAHLALLTSAGLVAFFASPRVTSLPSSE